MKRHLVASLALLLSACERDPSLPPPDQTGIRRFEVAPVTVSVGERATYTWQLDTSAIDPTAASCELDIDNDAAPEYTPECAAGSQAHTFSVPGTFTATLTMTVGGQRMRRTSPEVRVTGSSGTFTEISWRPATPAPFGIAEGQSVSLGGKLYVFGGFDSESPYPCCRPTDRAYVFDPTTEVWQPLTPLPPMNNTPYGGVNHAGFTTDGRDIYFAGG